MKPYHVIAIIIIAIPFAIALSLAPNEMSPVKLTWLAIGWLGLIMWYFSMLLIEGKK